MTRIVIDPVSRVSGLLNVEVEVKNDRIISAKSSGSQFRGFEKMFQGRHPLDIIRLSPRVCGICSTHHAIASTLALEDALKVNPDNNGKVVRDIANGFELLQNYIRHIYFFVIPDYVKVVSVNPLYKTISSKEADYRLSKEETNAINTHYVDAIQYSREAHRGVAILAGKVPHCHGIFVGGTTTKIDIQQIEGVRYCINSISDFVENKLIQDVFTIAKSYSDYFKIGKGTGNLMSFGLYWDYKSPIKYSKPSTLINDKIEDLEINNITESIKNTWADNKNDELIPGVSEPAEPNAYKEGAYTWVNAPRYKGYAMEVGALARMILSGEYNGGVSTMDRIVAKALEAKRVCEIIKQLIEFLRLGNPHQKQWEIPNTAKGIGLTEAERGSLGHWIYIDNKKVANYTLIPPSSWNLSPTDGNGIRGTVEEALIGTNINNIKNPVEIGRIVRSFDPCLNCAAHVVSDKYETIKINII